VRKAITWLVTVVLVMVLGIVIWKFTSHHPKFSIGTSLPPGIVSPQLAIGLGGATLLAPNGSLWVWGYTGTMFRKGTNTEVPIQLGSETDWSQIAMGGWNNTFAIKTNGTLWGFGGYECETHGIPNPMKRYTKSTQPARIGADTNWAQIRAGRGYNVALKTDGSLWAWGENDNGQVGDGTTNDFQPDITRITQDHDWKAIAIGDDYNVNYSFALKQNGTVWGWGPNFFDAPWNINRKSLDLTTRQIDPGTNWTAISFGYLDLFALKDDGTLWICDRNRIEGRKNYWTSSAASDQSSIFTQLDQGHDWQRINGFGAGLIAVKSDGSYWFFGDYRVGFLGLGNGPSREAKSLFPCGVEPWAFDENGATTLLLAKDGTLWSLGRRIGIDEAILVNAKNTRESILGDRWPSLGDWVFKKLAVDQVPHKIWELPTEMRHSLNHPSEVNAQEINHPSP
jgi:alpha-tubulin suppressor-like RCC1 family protein